MGSHRKHINVHPSYPDNLFRGSSRTAPLFHLLTYSTCDYKLIAVYIVGIAADVAAAAVAVVDVSAAVAVVVSVVDAVIVLLSLLLLILFGYHDFTRHYSKICRMSFNAAQS